MVRISFEELRQLTREHFESAGTTEPRSPNE